jgi:hypothetical protein
LSDKPACRQDVGESGGRERRTGILILRLAKEAEEIRLRVAKPVSSSAFVLLNGETLEIANLSETVCWK